MSLLTLECKRLELAAGALTPIDEARFLWAPPCANALKDDPPAGCAVFVTDGSWALMKERLDLARQGVPVLCRRCYQRQEAVR